MPAEYQELLVLQINRGSLSEKVLLKGGEEGKS
jgi:hypothetical protein